MSDPLVSVERLRARLDAGEDLALLDAAWFMPDSGMDGRTAFLQRHLPGARFFDIDAVADRASPLPHMVPDAEGFAAAMGALGVRPDQAVVVYDRPPVPSAPRVWWTLTAFGHGDVQVLDGGLEAWIAAGGALASGESAQAPTTYPARPLRPAKVRDASAVAAALENGSAQVVDARPAARFRGEAAEPRAGLRSGHMPGAANLPAAGFYGADGLFLPAEALQARFQSAGVDPHRPVIASCGSGVTAGVVALALARLGEPEAAIYDGSWAEWGALAGAPIATGP